MVGVELDPTTAAISSLLYPSAQIRNEGFEQTRVPENSFTATIGNVPFGGFSLRDPAHNPAGHNIHNHFILKSVALTAPGGYVATISSHFTMDAGKQRARRDIAAIADLVGAVRLPTKAFARVAGTDVVTDILLFRTREDGQPPAAGQDWVDTTTVEVLDEQAGAYTEHQVNNYFVTHPENVLGEYRSGHGMHNAATLEVRTTSAEDVLAERVSDRLATITAAAVEAGLGLSATAETTTTLDAATFDQGLVTSATLARSAPEGSLRYHADSGRIQRWDGQRWAEHAAGRGKIAEWRQLLALRDLSTTLIRAQRDGVAVADRDQLRGELNRVYDAYVAKHGPVNRFTWTNPAEVTAAKHDERFGKLETAWRSKHGEDGAPYTGPVPSEVEEGWEEKAWAPTARSKRVSHLYGGMLEDPGYAVVAALEIFDDETMTARKAPIFATDVLGPREVREAADSVEEAIGISLDETRTVDAARVGQLLGVGEPQAREAMVGLVYPDPEGGELIPAAAYLSGNVRRKLAAAQSAAEADPQFAGNVTALERVQPRMVEAPEIHVRPGVPWISAADHADFVRDVFEVARPTVDCTLGQWTIKARGQGADNTLMTDTYGTRYRTAAELMESICNSKTIHITRPKEDVERTGGDPTDLPATFEAQEKARKISDRFAEWLWENPERTARLVGEYNARFNALRSRVYDGSHLALPGLGTQFIPHPYQRNAVARIISEPTVLLDHVVGAGKTGTMFIAAMELKRLGLARQPWIVVPNHLIEQVGREAKQWYPGANVLVGSGATTKDARRLFVAQTATSDWDMVIVPKSVFTAIGVSPERKAAHHEAVRAELVKVKDEAGNRDSVKSSKRPSRSRTPASRSSPRRRPRTPGCGGRTLRRTISISMKRTCTRTGSVRRRCGSWRAATARPRRRIWR
jgi:N12 class adenine-specific DNA methylase